MLLENIGKDFMGYVYNSTGTLIKYARLERPSTKVIILSNPFFVFGKLTIKSVAKDPHRLHVNSKEVGYKCFFPLWPFFCWQIIDPFTYRIQISFFTSPMIVLQSWYSFIKSKLSIILRVVSQFQYVCDVTPANTYFYLIQHTYTLSFNNCQCNFQEWLHLWANYLLTFHFFHDRFK